MSDSNQTLKVIDHPFQLEVNYAYLDTAKRPKNEFFLIDVITIDMIDDYIKGLEVTDVANRSQSIADEVFRERFFPADTDDTNYFSAL
jgi:hypothetical protein